MAKGRFEASWVVGLICNGTWPMQTLRFCVVGRFVAFGAQEPGRQTGRAVAIGARRRVAGSGGHARAQRAFAFGGAPTVVFHHDAHCDADGLPESHRGVGIVRREKTRHVGPRFEFAHDGSERRAVVMHFAVEHPLAPHFIVEEIEHIVEVDARIVHHVGELVALRVAGKLSFEIGHGKRVSTPIFERSTFGVLIA